jgi:hypothetical protein
LGAIAAFLMFYNNCGKDPGSGSSAPQATSTAQASLVTHSLSLSPGENLTGGIQNIARDVIADLTHRLDDHSALDDPAGRAVEISYVKFDSSGILGLTQCSQAPDNSISCEIQISTTLNPDTVENPSEKDQVVKRLETVLRHEIGHAFGIAHMNSPKELMYAYSLPYHETEPAIETYVKELQELRQKGTDSGLPLLSFDSK